MMRLTRLRSTPSSFSYSRGSEARYSRQGNGFVNGRSSAANAICFQLSHFKSTLAESNKDLRRPERSTSLPPHLLRSENVGQRQSSAAKTEVLAAFFKNRPQSAKTSGDNESKAHSHGSTTAETSTQAQERLKSEILRKFFAKRPATDCARIQRPDHAQPSSSSNPSKTSHTLKSNNVGPKDRSSLSITREGTEAPAALPRFLLARPPPTDQRKEPTRTNSQTASGPTDVTALRLALFGEQAQRTSTANTGGASSMTSQASDCHSSAVASASLESKTNSSFDAPLSDIIRRIQMEQAKRAEEAAESLKEQHRNGQVASWPSWRRTDRGVGVDLRSMRQNQRQSNYEEKKPDLSWGNSSGDENKRNKPVFVNPKDQVVTLPAFHVTLAEASLLLRQKASRLQRVLRSKLGVNINESHADNNVIDPETLELLAMELNIKFEKAVNAATIPTEEEILLKRRAAAVDNQNFTQVHPHSNVLNYASLPPRPPVVCILGHVDHGKTTLMDALRRRAQSLQNSASVIRSEKKKAKTGKAAASESNVAGTEAGGITQVISAFQVPLTEACSGSSAHTPAVTFLDTPGHAAFKAMRQSGSDAADIIVLVVAADDGVSAQTVEILDLYKSIVEGAGIGGISLVVAMNKIDKPGVDVNESRRRIESQLLEHGILVEGMPGAGEGEYGPPVQMIPVSGLTGEGLDNLVEGLMLQAEVMDLRADDTAGVEGIVMDARIDKGLGIVVDCIVRWGSISKGDLVVSGTSKGRVRILKDMGNKACEKGVPSQPVRIVGFESLPKAGDPLIRVETEEAANDLIARRKSASDDPSSDPSVDAELQSAGRHMMHGVWRYNLEEKYGIDSDGESVIRIPIVVKADADGTLAAIQTALLEIGNESRHNVVIEPIKVGVGPLLANEIQLAKEGGATIVCFNTKQDHGVSRMAEDEGVSLISGNVIYSLLDQAREAFARHMPVQLVEVVHGRAEVQATYEIGGLSEPVAGLRVTEGKLYRAKSEARLESFFRVLRKGKVVSQSELRASSLKHFKDDVEEIGRGKDCGLSLSGYSDILEGDLIECFSIEEKREFT